MKNLKKLKVMNKSMKTVFYERRISLKEKEKEKYDKKLSDVKKNTFVIGREKKMQKLSKKMESIDEDITALNFSIANSIDEQLMKRASYALKRWTGAEFQTEKDKLNGEFSKSSKVKKQQTKSEKTKKETTDALDDLIKSGALDNKEEISDATIKELKKILKVDEEIRDELKEIKENQIDEQDTKIKAKKKVPKVTKVKDVPTKGMRTAKVESSLLSTLVAAGLSAGFLAKIFNDYMKDHGDEIIPQWMPDWVKDLTLDDAPEVATTGLKTATTALKGASTAKRGATNATKKAIRKVSSNQGAKNATKKILKREANYVAKNSVKETTKKSLKAAQKAYKKLGVKYNGVVYKRIAGETTEALTKRISGDILERSLVKAGGKKVPGLGLTVAFGLAYMRYQNGESLWKVGGELLSGISAMFPGVGTGLAFVVDALLIWDDVDGIIEEIEHREEKERATKEFRRAGIQKLVTQKKEQAKVQKYSAEVEKHLSGNENYQSLKSESEELKKKHQAMVNSGNYNSQEFKALTLKLNTITNKIDVIRKEVKKTIKPKDMFAKERKALHDATSAFGDYAAKNGDDKSAKFKELHDDVQTKSAVLNRLVKGDEDALNKKYLAEATAEYDRLHSSMAPTPSTIGKSSLNQVVGKGLKQTGQASEAMNYFMSKGWTKEQAAGIVGNLMVESNLKTNALGDGGKAYGIAQWHPTRQADFEKIYGKDIRQSTLNEQMEFVHYELTQGKEKRAGSRIKVTQSAQKAAEVVDKFYERSSGQHRNRRIATATNLMNSAYEGTTTSEIQKTTMVVKKDSSTTNIPSNDITPAVVNKDTRDLQAMNVNKNLTNQTVAFHKNVQTVKQVESTQRVARANQAGNINSEKDDVSIIQSYNETGPVTS